MSATGRQLRAASPVKEIGALAKSRGIWFALDGAQAPGTMLIDLREWNVDFYTFSSHEWILAPQRTGVLYLTKDKLDVSPVTVGAYSDNGYNIKDGELISSHRHNGMNMVHRMSFYL